MRRIVVLVIALAASCSKGARHDPEEQAMPLSTSIPVAASLQGKLLERPPRVRLLLDVRMRNDAPGSRWFIFPMRLGNEPSQAREIVGASTQWLGPDRQVSIGEFTGVPGFQAMLLPAGGEIRVRGLPVTGQDPDLDAGVITLEVLIARDLTIGGEPASAWFGGDPTCAVKADVQWSNDQVRSNRDNPGFQGVPASFIEERRLAIPVAIKR